ncbi:MAG: isoleucine--tRNA ligase [Bacteroidota bacterium]|jgi:isoleucyl-tRNA synthetase
MFKELTDKINYSELEKGILKFWEDQKIFEQSVSSRDGKPGFTFYEGPPTANGRPGIHHVMSRTLKDLVCRYKTMRGFQVHRKAGWDTHGLPVEIEVEKSLGFKHKEDIVRYGVARFNEECRKSVWKYKADWEEMTRRMGYWVDLKDPYITFENNYIESIWWALKQFFDKGLIYKGYKVQPYCPRCETPLSSHEVALGYDDVKDVSVYVKMNVGGEEDTYFLVWTTTPWTLISNVALAVHPDVDYVKIEHKGEKLILAEARLAALEGEYTVLERFKGSSLAGKGYERLFNYHPVKEKAFYVVEADFVTTEDGTGIVHMAPAYGEDDYQMGRKYGLPTIHPVNKSGEFGPEVTDFAGKFVKDADTDIIRNLKERHLLYKKETIVHSYPHCWRCDTPLLYYARESWYIATTKYAQRMIELNKTIHWYPPEVGTGRFGNWLEENKDWSLSRDRFWGTPLPIWVCEKCGDQKCIGSIGELEQVSGIKFQVSGKEGIANLKPETSNLKRLDLHKPFVDEITWSCTCGGIMRRTPELIDVWFDSGAMPFAQWHYPFENKKLIDSGEQHPADYICEGIDQTRGWFYSLHAISSFLFDRPAFKNIIVNELILDKDGQKMSKSRGNTVDPIKILDKYGADTTRWYLVTTSPPWRPTLFDEDGLTEVQRKFLGTLLNTYAFFALYANIDGFTYSENPVPLRERPEIDRWIISSLHSLIRNYVQAMDGYDVTKAARAVSDFTIDQLSNWYVRRNRRRFWKNEQGGNKTSAYQTLYECLTTVTKLMAPFAPFLAEKIYLNLNSVTGKEPFGSVHLAAIPEIDISTVDEDLESRMEKAQRIVSLARAIRNKSNLKVRQPLMRVIIPVSSERGKEAIKRMEDVILDEINVKQIEFVDDDSGIVQKRAKPNFKTLGPKHGKSVQAVAGAIKGFGPGEIRSLEKDGQLTIPVNGSQVLITKEDVDILHEDIKGWLVESDDELTVALDTTLTEELIQEGFAREFVNRIQNMRKDAGFDVTDRVRVYYKGNERLERAFTTFGSYIRNETLALELGPSYRPGDHSAELDINGENCLITIERAQVPNKNQPAGNAH